MTEQNPPEAPAPGTKADLEAKLAAVQAENETLRGQLTEARAGAASPARITFAGRPQYRGGTKLSEGERQDLEMNGVANDPNGGGLLLASDFGVEVKTEAGRTALENAVKRRDGDRAVDGGDGIEGVDFVYPSVARGVLAEDAPVRGGVVDGTPTA